MWRISALDAQGREIGQFELAGGELTIGRETDRQLILPSASVSRRHARIIASGQQLSIVDDGSSNGVMVDGVRIAGPTLIGPSSQINLAEFRLNVMPLGGVQASPQVASSGELIRLIAEGGPYDGRFFDVAPGSITVGRALENELVFDDPSLSRKHARLTRDAPGRFSVEDLGSSNGTFVNGRKVQRGSAGVGDAVQFGDLLFRVEGQDASGTRAVDTSGTGGQGVALAVVGGVTALVMIGMVVALIKKPPTVQASGRDAIARFTRQADQHLKAGRALYRERKYNDAKQELDAALDVDPANLEARRLSRLAAHGPDDDRAYQSAQAPLAIGDRKGLEQTIHWYEDLTEGSAQRQQLQSKLTPALERFGLDRCARRQWPDCAWALCREFEVASAEAAPDARVRRDLDDAERHLTRDRSYVPCAAARR